MTDRRTDGQTELRWLRRAESIAAFARKKEILNVLTAANAICVPRRKVGFYKYWCDVELDELKLKCIEPHKRWVAAGRPMSGDVYERKRVCMAQSLTASSAKYWVRNFQ